MDHKLRPIVRVDADMRSATVELHGCLTVPATSALLKILGKGRSLNPQLVLGLDLRHARHIEEDCLKTLHLEAEGAVGLEADKDYELDAVLDQLGHVKVVMPKIWPVCPVDKVLTANKLRELSV